MYRSIQYFIAVFFSLASLSFAADPVDVPVSSLPVPESLSGLAVSFSSVGSPTVSGTNVVQTFDLTYIDSSDVSSGSKTVRHEISLPYLTLAPSLDLPVRFDNIFTLSEINSFSISDYNDLIFQRPSIVVSRFDTGGSTTARIILTDDSGNLVGFLRASGSSVVHAPIDSVPCSAYYSVCADSVNAYIPVNSGDSYLVAPKNLFGSQLDKPSWAVNWPSLVNNSLLPNTFDVFLAISSSDPSALASSFPYSDLADSLSIATVQQVNDYNASLAGSGSSGPVDSLFSPFQLDGLDSGTALLLGLGASLPFMFAARNTIVSTFSKIVGK